MKFIKSVLIFILVLTIVGAGAYYASSRIHNEKLQSALHSLQVLKPLADASIAKAGQLAPMVTQLGKVLGAKDDHSNSTNSAQNASSSGNLSNESTTKNIPLMEKTFEFARYTYCQQVVSDYEKRYSGK